MATVNKNFRIKDGLIVEGTTGTINGNDILTTASNTDQLSEGTTNLFFTAQRAQDAVSSEINTAVSSAINALTTDDIEEGTSNLYFTAQRAVDAGDGVFDAYGAASSALTSANGYTDTAISGLSSVYDALGAASGALTSANSYTDTAISTAVSGLAPNYITSVNGSLSVIDGQLSIDNNLYVNSMVEIGGSVDSGIFNVKDSGNNVVFSVNASTQTTQVEGDFKVEYPFGSYTALNVNPASAIVTVRNKIIATNDDGFENITINGNAENITFYNTATNNNSGIIGTDGANFKIDANTGDFAINVPNGNAIINPDGVLNVFATANVNDLVSINGLKAGGQGNGANGYISIQDASNNNIFNVFSPTEGESSVEFHGTQTLYANATGGGAQYGRLYNDGGNNLVIDGSNNDIILTSDSGYAYIGNNSSAATRIATQAYVDATAQGLSVHGSVWAATNAPITYNDFIMLTSVDGVVLPPNARVLAKNISDLPELNGIYIYNGTTAMELSTSPTDAITLGSYTFIQNGSQAAQGWIYTNSGWTQFSAAGEYTASTGITITGNAISVTANTYDAYGAAGTAESNANSYTDTAISGLSSVYDALGAASTAETNAKTYADNNFVNVADLPGQLGDYVLLTEKGANNGVATLDSTGQVPSSQLGNVPTAFITSLGTSESNLSVNNGYLELTTTPSFTSVDINSYRKEEATQQYVSTASTVDVHSFSYPHESVKYLVRVVGSVGGTKHSQITEILVTVDGSNNIAMTEFGTVCTNSADLASFSARNVGGTFYLTATTAGAGFEVIAAATLLSWAD